MLAVVAKVKVLKHEVFSAKHFCRELIRALLNVREDSDFKKEIGIFALQAPKWIILTDEKCQIQDIVRKVCTGEMPPNEAVSSINKAIKELDELDSWLQIPAK